MKRIVTIIPLIFISVCNTISGMDGLITSLATHTAIKAIKEGSLSLLKLALTSDAAAISHVDKYGNNLLLLASKLNKKDIVDYLMTFAHFQNSAIINQQNYLGENILYCLCYFSDNKQSIETLLQQVKGIDTNTQDHLGYTPLHIVTKERYDNYSDIALLLLQHGANPTIKNCDSAIPAMYPIDTDLWKELTKARDSNGNTYVHLLAMTTAHDIQEERTIAKLFTAYLNNCLTHIPNDIWATNHDDKLPIEVAYETYRKHRLEYDMSKARHLLTVLKAQEQQLHDFARFYALHLKNTPITIKSPCADYLNVETAIAEQYKDDTDYERYHVQSLRYKDKLKQDLFNKLDTVPKLYVSKEEYVAPKILSIQKQ
jgi:hypothetical protein